MAKELGYKDYRDHQRDLKIMELKRKAMGQRLKAMEEQRKEEAKAARGDDAEALEDEGLEGSDEEYIASQVSMCCLG